MRFALFYEIPVAAPWGPDSERRAYEQHDRAGRAGERFGWDAFWTVEHHFLEEYSHCSNPEVLYGAIAAKTERIRLGYGVRLMPKPYNHPVRTAESVAVLDLISNGRVDFGTGRSSTRAELEGFGVDPHETREMWQEAIEHVVGCWTNEEYEFDGKHWQMPRGACSPSRSSSRTRRCGAPRRARTATDRSAPRARAVLVRRRPAARRGEAEDRHLPRGRRRVHRAHRQVRPRRGGHVHHDGVRPDARRSGGRRARESFEWYPGRRPADRLGRRRGWPSANRTSATTPTPAT